MTTTVLPTFNTRMMRATTFSIPRTFRDVNGFPVDLTGAKVFYAIRGDIKLDPSVKLTSDSASLAQKATLTLSHGTVVRAKTPGALGNLQTLEIIADGSGAGTTNVAALGVKYHFEPTTTTVLQMETSLAATSLLEIATSSTTPATVLASPGDVLPPTVLAGGVDSINRLGVVINPDQNSYRGQYTITVIPADTSGLVALGDDDPWLHESWIEFTDGSVLPDFTVSKLAIYPQAVTIP